MLETFEERQQEARERADSRKQEGSRFDSDPPESSPILAIGWPPEETYLHREESLTPKALEDSPVWAVRQLARPQDGTPTTGSLLPTLRSRFPLQQSQPLLPATLQKNLPPKCESVYDNSKEKLMPSSGSRLEGTTMTDNGKELSFQNEANIPGAAGVIRCHGGAGFYCTVHKHEIQPLMFEVEGDEIPCCEECMLEEMVVEGREVRTPEAVDPLTAAVGDHDIAEDAIWECMT